MDNKVSKEMKKDKELIAQTSYFWGKLIAYATIVVALFSFFTDGYYGIRLETYLFGVDMNWIALAMIVASVVKLIGVYADIEILRGLGIVGLTIIWGVITAVSYLFSFGIGYPNDDFILNTFILIACFRVSWRGVLDK